MIDLSFVPLGVVLTLVASFGVIIGSFLNVCIYRFHTGKSLTGSSHCLSCARTLAWYELIPVLSYVVLRGRCRTCRSRVPSRYLWVELSTAVLFAWVAYSVADVLLWPLLLVLMAVLMMVLVYDVYHLIIPHAFVWALTVLALLHEGYRLYSGGTLVATGWALVGVVGAFAFFAGLWWYSGGRWIGLGDAKLVAPLALMVGGSGVFSMVVLSFWVGTVVSLSLLGLQYVLRRGQGHLRFMASPLTIKSEVPFAPFLIAGFLLVYLGGVNVLSLFSYAF